MAVKLPIRIDPTSNGEFAPVAVPHHLVQANALADRRISRNAGRVGASRRAFVAGLCGAATTLLTFNQAFAATGNAGGRFRVHPEGAFEVAAAADTLSGTEFVLDSQTHLVEPNGPWRTGASKEWARWLLDFGQAKCGDRDPIACFDADHFVKEVFFDSDTSVAVLTFVPSDPSDNPLTMAEALRVQDLLAKLDGTNRLLLHYKVMPNWPPFAAQLASMDAAAARWKIAAWKCYTGYGPGGVGWFLDDPKIGVPFLERARALGIKTICIHKGLPFQGQDAKFASCEDVGRAARLFPDINFVIFHSGFDGGVREAAYNPRATRGIDTLTRSLIEHGIAPNSNVYAELGSTWRMLMRDPTAAAHTIGKLMKYVGENRGLWGTDSIWYGSPQDQIQAFRAFEIAPELVERFGYVTLTAERKAAILGLNGAALWGVDPSTTRRRADNDWIGRAKRQYAETPAPGFDTYGPRTAQEFAIFRRMSGGEP